jgi:hypothetical protein
MGNVKKPSDLSTKVEQLLNAPYGMQGANIINNTAAQSGAWYCIIAIADNTTLDVSGCTINWEENGGALSTDLDLITGLPYYGDFSAVQLVDGAVICYSK